MRKIKKPIIDVTGPNSHFSESAQSISSYLKDVRKYNVLNPQEEREILSRIKNGDKQAVNELVNANQRFIFAVAKKFSTGDNLMDLVQVGNLGMLTAIDKFDPDKKGTDGEPIRFLSLASWYIHRDISYYLANNGLIKKTNNIKTTFKVNKEKNKYYLEHGRYPSVDELADIMEKDYGIKIKDLSYLYDIETKYLTNSYGEDNKKDTLENSPAFTDKSSTYNEYLDKCEDENDKYVVNTLLDMLKPRDRMVVEYLFGIGKDREYTIDEVAKILNLTRERVRQIKISSVNRLKKFSKSVAV